MRLACCVPGCRRTRQNDEGYAEWICGKHWRLVSPHLRKRDRGLLRKYRNKFGKNPFWAYPAGSPNRIMAVKLGKLCDKSWDVCKRQAIERAMGI